VILVDANLLVYAHVASFPQHDAARKWLDGRLNGQARVGRAWPSLLAYLRLVTNPRVFERPERMLVAWRQVADWLNCPCVWIPQPTDRHETVLGALLAAPGVQGNLVPDAHLAVLALEHGLTLYTTDGDFARFNGLRWENPIAVK